MLDVEEIVKQTLRQMHSGEAEKIKPDTVLKDLLLDSLDMLEFKMRLEEKLDVELKVEVFDSAATLREITRRVVTSLQRL